MKLLNNIKGGVTGSILATVCCVVFSGCTENNGSGFYETETLHPSFHTSSEGFSKAIITGTANTAANDKINSLGIYLTTEDHKTYPQMTDRFSQWTLNNNVWETSNPIFLSNQKALLYAYSPASLTVTAGTNNDAHTIPVTVPSSLTFNGANSWECNGTDYLYGSSEATVGNSTVILASNKNNKPKVYLQHAMAQVVIKMQSVAGRSQDATYDYVKSVTLSAQAPSAPFLSGTGVMQIKDGAITSLTGQSEMVMTPLNANEPVLSGPSGNPAVVAYGLVAPVTFAAEDNITITVVLGAKGNNANDRIQSVTSDSFKVKWEKGNKYIYNLSLGNHKIEVAETSIGEWTEVPSTGEMNPDGF